MAARKSFIGIVRSDQSAQQGYVDVYSPFFQGGLDYANGHPDYTFPNTLKKISTRYGAEFNCYDENNRVSTDPGPYPGIVQNIDTLKNDGAYFIGYDLEGPNSPASEVNNPVRSVQNAHNLASSKGLKLECAPGDPNTTVVDATNMAPYIDIYVIQGEGKRQLTPAEQAAQNPDGPNIFTPTEGYKEWVRNRAVAVRKANSNAIIIAELSTTPGGLNTSLDGMQQAWSAVMDVCDGMTVWPGNEADTLLRDFVSWFCR